ncbi:MAG: DUF3343 domain-containing protein [Bacteroidales bacterium]|nr:DUF3343 domain-containing protein [Bacteroidales bacterium]
MYCFFTYDSIHFVLKSEKILLENNVKLDIIPTPRDLSSNCGMCIKVKSEDKETVMQLMLKNKIATSYHFR